MAQVDTFPSSAVSKCSRVNSGGTPFSPPLYLVGWSIGLPARSPMATHSPRAYVTNAVHPEPHQVFGLHVRRPDDLSFPRTRRHAYALMWGVLMTGDEVPDLLTQEEAIRILCLDEMGLKRPKGSLRHLRRTGQLAYVKVVGKVLIPRDAIQDYLEQNRVQSQD